MKSISIIQAGLLILTMFISMTVNAQGLDSCSNVTISMNESQYNDSVRYIENYEIYNDSITSCKSINNTGNLSKKKIVNLSLLGYKNVFSTNLEKVSNIPSYSFKIPKNMLKWGVHDIGRTLVELTDNQYIYIIYEPDEILDVKGLICHLDDYLASINKDFNKNIDSNFIQVPKNHRLNILISKGNFKIGLLNIRPKNIEFLIKLIEDSFNEVET